VTHQLAALYPDGSMRMVNAYERTVPVHLEVEGGRAHSARFLEPVESEDWTFVFQVEAAAPGGGLFRAIPLRDQLQW
jgi:hypothetical protein